MYDLNTLVDLSILPGPYGIKLCVWIVRLCDENLMHLVDFL